MSNVHFAIRLQNAYISHKQCVNNCHKTPVHAKDGEIRLTNVNHKLWTCENYPNSIVAIVTISSNWKTDKGAFV